jgi:membrane protein DedA with SNARE-associated domain
LSSRRNLERWKGNTPQLLVLAIVVIGIVIISLDTLEDTLIEGGTFRGTPLDILLNGVIMFTQNVTATVSSWGYVGIFLSMLLEASSLPIPSEVILPFAGYLVSLGQLNLWVTVLVATLAGIAGSLIDYYVGMKGMNLITRRKVLGQLFSNKARSEMVEKWFNRYGAAVVFLGRLVPGFRTLVSFPAGAARMSLTRFIAYTLAGCLVWNVFLTYIGVHIGANWREVADVSHYIIIGVVVAILVAFIVLLIRRKKRT